MVVAGGRKVGGKRRRRSRKEEGREFGVSAGWARRWPDGHCGAVHMSHAMRTAVASAGPPVDTSHGSHVSYVPLNTGDHVPRCPSNERPSDQHRGGGPPDWSAGKRDPCKAMLYSVWVCLDFADGHCKVSVSINKQKKLLSHKSLARSSAQGVRDGDY